MKACVAIANLQGSCPFEVVARIELIGDAYAAVNLDELGRHFMQVVTQA